MPDFQVAPADQGSEPSDDMPPRQSYGRYNETKRECLRCQEVFVNGPFEKGYYCDECMEKINNEQRER